MHATLLAIWVALGYPTVVYWRSSILWVAFMSLYTIWWQHGNGWLESRIKAEAVEQPGQTSAGAA
jgi:hypothetical protein